ncbi:MAG: methyl-accepting chemotaxis protein [Betaproteobacteria bacterium]|nr:methyl-accepting chemotaxis protein [Betaproteobacteria bacterium]
MMLAGAGVLTFATATLALICWYEFASLEEKLRAFSENELKSLNALVDSAMARRLDDPENVAIEVFNGWFKSRNEDYSGKLWSVWGPKVTAYMAKTAPEHAAKAPLDSVDQEALRTGEPIGRFVDGTYRYSLPIVLGKTSGTRKEVCDACHIDAIGETDGDVIAVFSSSISTAKDVATLWQLLLLMTAGTVVAVLLVILGIRLIFGSVITRPLTGMTDAMRRLADGDKTIEVPTQDRADEIGKMAGAILVFKDNMIETDRLRAEQKTAETRAAEQRKADMHKLADEFDAAVGGIVNVVSSAASELGATASILATTAEANQQQASTVAAVSEVASTRVQLVASASDALAASVNEIARHVQESSKIANEAVEQARMTDTRITKLSQAAQRIGDVVKLIAAVAEQTNLLALNATIEAARAGEAGRGFAVVAQEVKALAIQTAKATCELASQISSMQTATQDSVNAINEIMGTICCISEIATVIAAAVEQQGAATQSISQSVQEVAGGTATVAANITEVSRGASQTNSASAQVLNSAQVLSKESAHLQTEVGKFLSTVRAA